MSLIEKTSSSSSSVNSNNESDEEKSNHDEELIKQDSAIRNMLEQIPELNKHFNIHKKIGEGTFSSVYLATIKIEDGKHKSNKQFALKHLIPTSHPKRIKAELDCLNTIGGKDNVVSCLTAIRRFDCMIFVMPYLEHQKFLDYVIYMDVEETRLYMKNLLLALKRVHSFNIIHRDVKPSNFLYNRQTKEFLLVDFGLAQHVTDNVTGPDTVLKTEITPLEPLKKRKRNDEENQETEGTPSFQPKKRQALQILTRHSSNELRPQNAFGSRSLLNNSGRQNQPLSSMQRLAEAVQVKRNLENSLNYSQNCPLVKKGGLLNNENAVSFKRQPLSTNNSENIFSNSPKKGVKPPSFLNILPHKGKDVSSSFIRVQVQDGLVFPKPILPAKRINTCDCNGKSQICNLCIVRKAQNAPRAGTPGFRPPEVLLRYHNQTTAVDIWAAGVIMICILSGCYPFFRSPDDTTALSEIMTIFGSERILKLARKLDRNIVFSDKRNPLYLRALCERLRNRKADGTSLVLDLQKCSVCRHTIIPEVGCLCENNYKSILNVITFPDSAYDLLKRLLEIDPESRISAEDALNHPFLRKDV